MIFSRRTWKDWAAYHACLEASVVESEERSESMGQEGIAKPLKGIR